jgi:5-(carboxyamino)imidazole ribonucleotide synthase
MIFNQTRNLKIGILGGGQLGKMLCLAAADWDLNISLLDPDPNCSARTYCTHYTQGHFNDFEAVMAFGQSLDVLTVEIEHVNTAALRALQKQGKIVHPDPALLELIQDKSKQKKWYVENNIPTEVFDYQPFKHSKPSHYPIIWKAALGGYDGKGVALLNKDADFDKMPDTPYLLEQKTDIDKEIAVMVARNSAGEVVSYPPVEMIFDKEANLLDYQLCPASLDKKTEKKARLLAESLIKKLNLCGLLAVELFLNAQGELLVNEIAPRPHNSGHHTIETVETAQFEQHWRAILNLPLGSTRLLSPSVLLNIVGEKGHTGVAKYEGFDHLFKTSGAHLHLYGKTVTKPFRKMGHLTVADVTVEKALQKALDLKKVLKVKAGFSS